MGGKEGGIEGRGRRERGRGGREGKGSEGRGGKERKGAWEGERGRSQWLCYVKQTSLQNSYFLVAELF